MTQKAQKDEETTLIFTTPPNLLTLLRILLVPFMVIFMSFHSSFWDVMATLVFIVASITDYFDGYLARKKDMVSVYGKLMDPLADKFLVASALIMLLTLNRVHEYIVTLLICREFAVTGLRSIASAEGLIIPASRSAKWKTATQMVAIPLLIFKEPFLGIPIYSLGQLLLLVSLLISLGSAQVYVMDFFKALKIKRRKRKKANSEPSTPHPKFSDLD